MFGHIPELIVVLVIGLLIFGPKRMIDIGSSLGKAYREFREATREMSWSNLMSSSADDDKSDFSSARSRLSQVSQTILSSTMQATTEEPAPHEPQHMHVVEGSAAPAPPETAAPDVQHIEG